MARFTVNDKEKNTTTNYYVNKIGGRTIVDKITLHNVTVGANIAYAWFALIITSAMIIIAGILTPIPFSLSAFFARLIEDGMLYMCILPLYYWLCAFGIGVLLEYWPIHLFVIGPIVALLLQFVIVKIIRG